MGLSKNLYLLVNLEESAVKVGVSVNPRNRSAALPVPINFGRSLEVELLDGSAARSVERMLHYLFRDRKRPMPYGDGHTEWFQIEALPEMVRFLEDQTERLGVAKVRPLSPRPPQTQQPFSANRSRLELFARQWSKAPEHNAKVFDWVRSSLQDMYAADIIVGILPPARRHGFLGDGTMCLRGRSCISAFEYLMSNAEILGADLTTLHGPGGRFFPIFPGGRLMGDIARISVPRIFLSGALPDNYERAFPSAEAIRAYLYPLVANVGSPEHKALSRIDRRLSAEPFLA